MKRALQALLVLLLAAAAVLPFWRGFECPDCAGPGLGGNLPIGCPRCGDAHRISALNRWLRSDLHPDLVALNPRPFVFTTTEDHRDFVNALRRRLAPCDPPVDADRLVFLETRFVDDGLLALSGLVQESTTSKARWVLVLFERDGRILDQVQVGFEGESPRVLGDWVEAELRRNTFRVVQLVGGKPFRVLGKGGVRSVPARELRFRLKNGAWDVEVVPDNP